MDTLRLFSRCHTARFPRVNPALWGFTSWLSDAFLLSTHFSSIITIMRLMDEIIQIDPAFFSDENRGRAAVVTHTKLFAILRSDFKHVFRHCDLPPPNQNELVYSISGLDIINNSNISRSLIPISRSILRCGTPSTFALGKSQT